MYVQINDWLVVLYVMILLFFLFSYEFAYDVEVFIIAGELGQSIQILEEYYI